MLLSLSVMRKGAWRLLFVLWNSPAEAYGHDLTLTTANKDSMVLSIVV